ncbi:MAG: ABC transporter permease [Bacteroidaceae bacterium]|nr:ABC transporter permease [Bacteroidaceae bacterium]
MPTFAGVKKFLRNLYDAWREELAIVVHDKGILVFCVFVPLAYPLLYAYVYTNEVVREVPLAVVDDCRSARSRELVRMVDASPDVDVAGWCASMEEAEERMRRREVYGVLRIPSDFNEKIARGGRTRVMLYCDMSSMLYYKALLLTLTNTTLEMNRDIKVERNLHPQTRRDEELARWPVEYEQVALFNPQSGFAAFLIPPVLMLILQQTLLLGIGMARGNARERRLPHRRTPSALVGRALVYLPLYVVMGVYAFVVVNRVFDLPCIGNYWTFLAFLVPYLLACIFFTGLLSQFIYRREDCILLFVFLSVPLLFLSGVSLPTASMPAFWRWFAALFPSTYGMNAYVRISTMGAPLSAVRTELIALCVQAAMYFALGVVLRKNVKLKSKR